ncbi:proton-conducting transporter transmembrane domain-containing protein [Parasporobacterium paucivorans]|uniref:Hydrogenase-4 component F n=1 Tax=Parasporobacterium paucivorans DSM 15970 TaxID=1122934 RepID=A0A1M6FCK7_9FIRM|nr:proton-conducting transporter membrane subunit [Parasporobacterium paucivorans]SHI95468.1 hydrogenase-4 component F [Parasporobacterium paucivorans DSM 15970]
MEILIIFSILIITSIISFISKNLKFVSISTTCGILVCFLASVRFIVLIRQSDSIAYFGNLVYLDSLNVIQIFIITSVALIAAVYSYRYILNEVMDGEISIKRARIYYFLFNAFVFSMLITAVSNNVMGMWIGLEATTIATSFLIGFHRDKLSLEAAWKYIIICSTGLIVGLVGIIMLIYSAEYGATYVDFSWTSLLQAFSSSNGLYNRIGFTLIFVGLGTKVGFAPMHTWLSDGHSEAPSPISAMMSGVLLNLAMYVILRFYIIVKSFPGLGNLKYLFIVFGLVSLIVSSFSMLKQTNYKRLLAFSSIENMGIIAIGIGFGGFWGIFGALLHSVVHAFGKSLLFLGAGNLLSALKTKRIEKVNSLVRLMPKNAVFLIIGMLIIVGSPPFATFFSEFSILNAGIQQGHYISAGIYLLCLILVFAGFLNIFIRMIFKNPEGKEYVKLEKDNENIWPLVLSLAFVVLITITFSNYFVTILEKAVSIIGI